MRSLPWMTLTMIIALALGPGCGGGGPDDELSLGPGVGDKADNFLDEPDSTWSGTPVDPEIYWSDDGPPSFRVCFDWSCNRVTHASLSQEQWDLIFHTYFEIPAATAMDELHNIRRAIGKIEEWIALEHRWYFTDEQGDPLYQLGRVYFHDLGGNTQDVDNHPGRMDCVDNASNTLTYLTIMQAMNMFRFHEAAGWEKRYHGLVERHYTAAIRQFDPEGGDAVWAIDSWFRDNGLPATIQPLDDWRSRIAPDWDLNSL